jgi:hypothetical protein
LDSSATPQTWCCPNPNDEWDDSWPVYNLGKPGDTTAACPYGYATQIVSENSAHAGQLTMNDWIYIGVGIAVFVIIVIVIIVIVLKKKNDERV